MSQHVATRSPTAVTQAWVRPFSHPALVDGGHRADGLISPKHGRCVAREAVAAIAMGRRFRRCQRSPQVDAEAVVEGGRLLEAVEAGGDVGNLFGDVQVDDVGFG